MTSLMVTAGQAACAGARREVPNGAAIAPSRTERLESARMEILPGPVVSPFTAIVSSSGTVDQNVHRLHSPLGLVFACIQDASCRCVPQPGLRTRGDR